MRPEQHELFVYYRVPQARAAELVDAVVRMQAALQAAHPGLRQARLLRRPDAADGRHTWMEAYAFDPASAPEQLAAAIEQAASPLAALIDGPRHGERFIACAS
ncbi:DUF4936 family protein [uncultured Methylibium sp.]|uniref:DUF4936 family protein n=1 Tax=uncultured Methylibium sp. TaxID=381093 RepID=UPI0025CF4988|nr:DUF4936 family protein [uncultured Methylibium sp.]